MPSSTERHAAKRITLFNHKGGVGKTTLTVNLGYALAALGKRVLLVDTDPQCNLTSQLVEESVVDDLLDSSDSPHGRTIWSALKPVVEGIGEIKHVLPFDLSSRNLFLLPGDIRLSEFEVELSLFWGECFQRRPKGFRGTMALSSLVNRICQDSNIDIVFFDAGPNIGALNRAVLLDSDFFIIPAACDLFSVRALKTLGHTLSNWIKDWRTVRELAPDGIYLMPGKPDLLGYIPQRFRIYRGLVAAGHADYVAKIERHIGSDVVGPLKAVDPTLAPKPVSQLRLGLIKDFGVLVTASQEQGTPISDSSAGNPAQREEARTAFVAIARKILERIAAKR